MKSAAPLTHIFRAHARVAVLTPGADDTLERYLAGVFETARAPWPDVLLPAEQFVRHLAERLPASCEGRPVEQALESLHLSDLYLACACADGLPGAIQALERDPLAKLPGLLRLQKHSDAAIEDVCQMVREKLLLRTANSGPHIATYTGEGRLLSWMSVIATRFATRQRGREKPAPEPSASEIFDGLPGKGDLEKDVIKGDLAGEFRSAVRDAFSSLSDEQRHLLKLYYGDGLSTPKLAKLFNTNQPSIWRRLESTRETIRTETKRLLRERIGLTEQDFESFFADLNSRLDVSLSQVFGVQVPNPDSP